MKKLPMLLLMCVTLLCAGCEAVQGYSASVRTKYGNFGYTNDGKTALQ